MNKTFTPTVRRITFWHSFAFIILFILFNYFIINLINTIITDNIDVRLKHEIDRLIISFEIDDDTFTILDDTELREHDFREITQNPFFLQVYTLEKEILLVSDNVKDYQEIPIKIPGITDEPTIEYIKVGKDKLRIAYVPFYNVRDELAAFIQVATINYTFASITEKIIFFNLLSLPAILLIIVLINIFLARKSFSPINKIINTANNITANNLDTRIIFDADPNDEPGKLRDTLNNLLERLETQVKQISQFTDNASHQLINPLTAMKTEMEYILSSDRTNDLYKESISRLHDKNESMIKVTKTLLLLAKTTQGKADIDLAFNASSVILSEVTKQFPSEKIQYEIEKEIILRGNKEYFKVLTENLIDNALKYANNSESIYVRLRKNNGDVILTVEDSGTGIDDSEKEKIFERFYRSSKSDKEGIAGYGLGLPLAKSIAELLGGKIFIADNLPKGTIVKVILPILKTE